MVLVSVRACVCVWGGGGWCWGGMRKQEKLATSGWTPISKDSILAMRDSSVQMYIAFIASDTFI